MPNHNRSEFISLAIESVQSQSLGAFELLFVDDASTDDSTRLVEEKSKTDPRISLIPQEVRRGASHSRNVGVQLTRADTDA